MTTKKWLYDNANKDFTYLLYNDKVFTKKEIKMATNKSHYDYAFKDFTYNNFTYHNFTYNNFNYNIDKVFLK